jgi:hypothetical protein
MQLTPSGKRALVTAGAVLLVINLLVNLYLWQKVTSQEQRINALERNDKITQSVKNLDTKIDGITDRIKGWFK